MKRIIKCGTAFLLALVLCLCLLPTTAFAASNQVYIWNFPLSDDTLKSSGNWGHGVLDPAVWLPGRGFQLHAIPVSGLLAGRGSLLHRTRRTAEKLRFPHRPQRYMVGSPDFAGRASPYAPRSAAADWPYHELRLPRDHWRRLVGRCREHGGEDGLGLCHAGPHLGGSGRRTGQQLPPY